MLTATRTWHRNIDGIMVGSDSLLICNSDNTNVDCSDIDAHSYQRTLWMAVLTVFMYAFLPLVNCILLCYACVVLKNRWYTVRPPMSYSPVTDAQDDRKPINIYEKIPNSNNDDFSEVNKDKAGLEQITRNRVKNWGQRERERESVLRRDIMDNDIEESLTSAHPSDADSPSPSMSLSYVSLNISSSANCSSPSSPLSLSVKP